MPTFRHENREIYYEEKGAGIPIVFIHPPAMGRKVFHFQAELGDHFRVVFPDLSGCGDTSGVIEKVSMLEFVNEIKALLDHLNIESAVICGYSSGGCVAQEFALTYPDRTLSLILSGGFAEVQSAAFKYEHIAGMYLVKRFPNFLMYLISSSHTNEKAVRNDILHHMQKADRRVWFEFYRQSLDYNSVSRLHQLKVPLLLMYGSRDFINQHLRSYKRYTNPQVVIIQKVSHQLPTKKWEEFNQVITGFIKENIK